MNKSRLTSLTDHLRARGESLAADALEALVAEVRAWRERAEWANAIALGNGVAPHASDEAKATAIRTIDDVLAARARVDALKLLDELPETNANP